MRLVLFLHTVSVLLLLGIGPKASCYNDSEYRFDVRFIESQQRSQR